MMGWKPINTVPVDEPVLLWRADRKVVEIRRVQKEWLDMLDFHKELAYTHWMELPEGPK